MRSGDEAHGERGVAADVAINAGRELRGRNFVADLKGFGGFAVAVAGLHGAVRLACDQRGLLLNLSSIQRSGVLHRAVVEPIAHAQREEIFAAVHALGVEAEIFQRGAGELGQLDGEQAIAVERMIFERIAVICALRRSFSPKSVEVDDQDAVGLQVRDIHFQRGGIHGDQDVNASPGVIDVAR